MSAMVRFGRRTAILRAGRWLSSDVTLETALNQHTSNWFQQGLAPARVKDQEKAVAEEIARQFNGRLTAHIRTRRAASDRHFFSQRQLGFDFLE